jgi:N-acyl-L-homoserine lactone synthetase
MKGWFGYQYVIRMLDAGSPAMLDETFVRLTAEQSSIESS